MQKSGNNSGNLMKYPMENLGPHAEGLTFSELHAQLSVPCWHRGLQAT